ncbi:ABC-2 transporter permease [Paraliobacillus sp. X-1268]|uniref:ABC-2 transporter permease n=1 Tax=Paraliobacillus sp. X-1268 TaxID=2213193 RepID=UPI000E3C5888|nr:ABC-2 transporter permease [Paraliobacillus sp. X-1268]
MFSLVMKDYYIDRSVLVGMLVLPVLGMGFIMEFTYFLLIGSIIISLFYSDSKTKIEVFNRSLPITSLAIVKGRYLFILLLAIFLLVFQWVIALIFDFTLNMSSPYHYQLEDLIIILSVFLVMTAVLVPLFYLFKSLYLALTIQFFSLFIFSSTVFSVVFQGRESIHFDNQTILLTPFIQDIIPFQPVPIIAVAAVVSYYLSIQLSSRLVERRLR